MARPMRWTRALGVPMSEGGTPICSKHEFIESNLGDSDMQWEMAQAVSAASKDGQNMEDALKERKEQIEEANSEIECMEREIRRLRISQLRRMIQRAEYIIAGLYISDRRGKKRLLWFIESCEREIAGLRGEG